MKKKLILLCILPFLLTGCWNYRELNEIAITTALAVDKTDEGYKVSILIANAKNSQVSSKEGESQTIVYSEEGKSITEAIKRINLKSPKQVYIGHLNVIVVSEEIAQEKMENVIDYFLREPESVKRSFLIIAKDVDASDVIEILSPLESFPAQNIYSNIKMSSESQALSPSITYSKFVENVLKIGTNPTLPTITIVGDIEDGKKEESLQQSTPDATIKLDKLAIFKGKNLLGYASEDESRGINIINNKVNTTTSTFKYGVEYISIALEEIKVTKNIDFIDNEPIINIKYKSLGALREISDIKNLGDPQVIKNIEKETENAVKTLMQKGINAAQNIFKSDIFGFGNMIYKKNPDYFLNITDWDNGYFPNLKINIDVDVELKTKGSLEQTLGGITYEFNY